MVARTNHIKWPNGTSHDHLSTTNFDDINEIISLLKCNKQDFYKVLYSEKINFKESFENTDAFKAAELTPGIYCIKSYSTMDEIEMFIKLNKPKPTTKDIQSGDKYQDDLSQSSWETKD